MIKILTYISKINKNQKEMNLLFQELMRNIKISFIEEESNIKYEDYYFNGIQIPKNIEFKDISTTSFKIYWKIDDINIININKKEIKYKVEIKKENEKFIKVYEGNNNNFLIDNLNKNTNYEIRICSIYNDIISNYSKIYKIKTKDLDSIILRESGKENEFIKEILEWSGYKSMKLIYRGSRDGTKSNDFHNKCDNQGPTICLFKNEKGYIFGGYSSISWTNDSGNYHSAPESFIFTLTNIYNIKPTKFPNSDSNYSVYHYSSYGPTFGGGHDINIYSDYTNNNNSYANFPNSYQDTLGYGKSIFTGDNNSSNFKLKEMEIFKLFK